MSLSLLALFAVQIVAAVLLIILAVQGFRTQVGWGFAALLVLLGPVACNTWHLPGGVMVVTVLAGLIGTAIFALKHQKRAGILFLLYAACLGTTMILLFTAPPVIMFYGLMNPGFLSVVKTVNPGAYGEAQQLLKVSLADSVNHPTASSTPQETRDLAENETPYPTATPDPNAALRTAYLKHAKDLAAAYQGLDAERRKLKLKSPAVAAFNAKAAHYQQDLQTLAAEKARLDALDHASNANAEAAVALASLRTAADGGDYEAFAATLKKSLSDYRQTPAFPGIVAFVRPVLQAATPDKVLAGLQGKAAATARAGFDKTTRQVQAIVNQVPPMVPKPPADAEVYGYDYHPGANPPDYNAQNLAATRELWKGEYVYIQSTPNVYYRSADCEFNPQTKYFFTSRTVPKKKLSDAEYAELTRLYHLLGQQQKASANVPPPTADAERVSTDLAALKAQLDGYALK